jgi:sodium-dependent dicarboxylate transporter 2/3/5
MVKSALFFCGRFVIRDPKFFIMNVAAIAISLPAALVIAPYLGVAGDVILFSNLVTVGMLFLLLVCAAPMQ